MAASAGTVAGLAHSTRGGGGHHGGGGHPSGILEGSGDRPFHDQYQGKIAVCHRGHTLFLPPRAVLAHVLGLDDAEMDCLARTGTSVAMCPVTAAKGGRGVHEHGRLPELLARGVKIALGCDSPNNSNHLDIVRTMNMAAIQYKDARQDMRQVPAETALELAMLTGAQALGLGDALGSIEPGKKADLVLFDTARPEWQALHNPVNNLVYNADGRSIHTVIVDGRVVVDAGRQTFVDETRLFATVQGIGEKLQARTGISFPRARWPIV